MAFPNIFPVEPGRDGWRPAFDTPVARLLAHCGLMPVKMVARKDKPSVMEWRLAKQTAPWEMTKDWDARPIKVSLVMVQKILKRVGNMHGAQEIRDILKVHGNCHTLLGCHEKNYRHVYMAAMASLDRGPRSPA